MIARIPSRLVLHRASRLLEVGYADGSSHQLACEYLRVYSPSAEVRGHGGGEPMLLGGKRQVGITAVEPVGRYAVRLRFDDGHDTGLYSWDILEELAANQASWWARYLERLAEHGMSRDSDLTRFRRSQKSTCLSTCQSENKNASLFQSPARDDARWPVEEIHDDP